MSTKPKSREARTRGPDLLNPINVPDIETPGGSTSKAVRRSYSKKDLDREHRHEMIVMARELGLAGATEIEAAEQFGVSVQRLRKWRAADHVFDFAMRSVGDALNAAVERSLFHKAMGYSYRSEKIMTRSLPGGGSEIVRVPVVEHVPPSEAAMIFWLKNRDRENWADRREIVDKTPPTDLQANGATDFRQLAMNIMFLLRKAVEENKARVIDHAGDDDEDDFSVSEG